jgi:hypothetical protein
MDCHSKGGVDFCEDPACAASTISLQQRDDLKEPHIPTHEVFKVNRILHSRYYAMTERKAKTALKKARELLSDSKADETEQSLEDEAVEESEAGEGQETAQNTEPTESGKQCGFCKEPVSISSKCWFCVDCGMSTRSFLLFLFDE